MSEIPQPHPAGTLWPVSVKAVVRCGGQVLLAYNERDEWELPGGKLDIGEEPAAAATREIVEETGIVVEPPTELLDAWIYRISDERRVLILTYDCPVETAVAPVVSDEHREVRWVPIEELADLRLPVGYRDSIDRALDAR